MRNIFYLIYKLYYHLLLRSLKINERYHIRIADRTVSKKHFALSQADRLEELMRCLNNGVIKNNKFWGNISLSDVFVPNVILTIEPRPAKDRILIQLADILMGAVGFHWEELHKRKGAKPSKVHLANYIAQKMRRSDLRFTTNASNRRFNIFYMNPGK